MVGCRDFCLGERIGGVSWRGVGVEGWGRFLGLGRAVEVMLGGLFIDFV